MKIAEFYLEILFIVPFLGPALGWTAMCSPGWGNFVAIDLNDLPVGREFDGKFLKNVKSPPHAWPPPPPPPPSAGLTLIGALATHNYTQPHISAQPPIATHSHT